MARYLVCTPYKQVNDGQQGLGGAASGRQVMDLVWIWHVEVSLRLPEVIMAPGKPALAPALPCLAVCATWSNTLSLYASLVFDPQVNDPDYLESLPL